MGMFFVSVFFECNGSVLGFSRGLEFQKFFFETPDITPKPGSNLT